MTVDLASLRRWDISCFSIATGRLAGLADHLDRVSATLQLTAHDIGGQLWQGVAARAAKARLTTSSGAAGRLAQLVREMVSVLQAAATGLTEVVHAARASTRVLSGTSPQHASEITGARPGALGLTDGVDAAWAAAVVARAAEIDSWLASELGRRLWPLPTPRRGAASFAALPEHTGSARPATVDPQLGSLLYHLVSRLPASQPDVGVPPPPAAGVTAEVAARWWQSLPAEGQRALIARQPALLGDLAGLPAWVRDRANRAELTTVLAALRREKAELGRRRTNSVTVRHAARVLGQLRTAEVTERALSRLAQQGAVAQLLTFDPAGQGRVAVVVGDLDVAEHVAFLVPGLNQTAQNGLTPTVTKAAAIAAEAGADLRSWAGDWGAEQAAVVAWVAYSAPGLAEVPFLARARAGGTLLDTELDGLVAARSRARPHTTVIGHSYGSTAVAAAAVTRRVAADDLVLVGSPGAIVQRADELGTPSGHVFVGEASFDWVADLAFFGADPGGKEFGAVRFNAEPRPGDPWWHRLAGADHSHYFQPGSESLRNIGRIVAGQSGEISLQAGEPVPRIQLHPAPVCVC